MRLPDWLAEHVDVDRVHDAYALYRLWRLHRWRRRRNAGRMTIYPLPGTGVRVIELPAGASPPVIVDQQPATEFRDLDSSKYEPCPERFRRRLSDMR